MRNDLLILSSLLGMEAEKVRTRSNLTPDARDIAVQSMKTTNWARVEFFNTRSDDEVMMAFRISQKGE